MNGQIFTVEELTKVIKAALEGEELFCDLWVRGEISNSKIHTSGHFYFTLKDTKASLKCVMFRSRSVNLSFSPQDGMRVLVKGSISVYEQGGQYQLYAEEIHLDGIGEMYLALEQLKERLAAEGLFAPERKRPIPLLPRRVGVVTSLTGAALRDIVSVIRRRFPAMGIIVSPAMVQGEDAPLQISQAIEALNNCGEKIDVIIVGRGGGSKEELWAFNHEAVVRAIASSRIPVISAVGHQTDFTLADFASDLRAPTPSAAAELAVCEYREIVDTVNYLEEQLFNLMEERINEEKDYLNGLVSRLQFFDPRRQVEQYAQRVDELAERLFIALDRECKIIRQKLAGMTGRLAALSPLQVLARGYAICQKDDGTILRTAAEIREGDTLHVRLSQGRLDCLVTQKEGEDRDA